LQPSSEIHFLDLLLFGSDFGKLLAYLRFASIAFICGWKIRGLAATHPNVGNLRRSHVVFFRHLRPAKIT